MMKKNSGQVLVLFLAMIPILISFIAIIGETGYLLNIKNKYSNITKEAINYALNSEKTNKQELVESYIKGNITDMNNLTVNVNDERIRVVLIKNQRSIFTKFIKDFNYTIKIDYIGYKQNNKIYIKE